MIRLYVWLTVSAIFDPSTRLKQEGKSTRPLHVVPTGVPTSNHPIIISSHVCGPQVTVAVGSGFRGLFAELSYTAKHSILVPRGSSFGLAR